MASQGRDSSVCGSRTSTRAWACQRGGTLSDVVWFGGVRLAAAILGIVALGVVRRYYAERMTSHSVVSRALFRITIVQMLAIL